MSSIWCTRCPSPTATSIAMQQGWLLESFEQVGVALRSLSERPVQERDAHYSVEGDFFREGGNIPPLVALSRGVDLVIVGMTAFASQQWVVTRSGDHRVRQLSDLKGRRLALPKRGGSLVDFDRATSWKTLECAIATCGLSSDDVDWVDVTVPTAYLDDVPPRPGALVNGTSRRYAFNSAVFRALAREEVDAVATRPPMGALYLEMFDGHILCDLSQVPGAQLATSNHPVVLTVSRAMAERSRHHVVRYLKVLLETSAWAAAHPVESRAAIARELSVPEVEMTASVEPSDFHQMLAPSLTPASIALLDEQCRWLEAHSFLAGHVDVHEHIDASFLEEAHSTPPLGLNRLETDDPAGSPLGTYKEENCQLDSS